MRRVFILIFIFLMDQQLAGRSLSAPLHVEAFDRGAGSTVMTRASREGMIYGNPALLTLGGSWVRWFGLQATLKARGNTPKLQALYKENKSTFTGESSSFLDFVEAVDIGVGPELSLSFLNQYASFNSFVDLATYFKYEPFGKVGVPGSRAILEGLGGASFSLSHAPMRWLSLGVTYSQVYGLYRDIVVTPLNSAEAAQTFDDFSDFGRGQSLNAGLLMISKNYNIDYSLGISARQIGGLVFTDDAHPTYPGTLNVGFGLALHNKGSVIHFSSELEDISAVTSLSLADRLKFGLRFLAWQHLGLALGYSFGQPTAAITLDAILLKLSVSASHRKIGFGGDAFLRPEYTLTTTIGY